MGIDKSNVRFVIHRDMPKDIESWYQEMGRAGRDGLESDCFLFYSWADVKMQERFLDDIADPQQRRAKHEATVAIFRLAEDGGCRHQAILEHFDEEIAPCDSACDVCSGTTAEQLAAEAMMSVRPGRRSVGGAGAVPSDGTGAGQARRGAIREVGRAHDGAGEIAGDDLFERLRALRKQLADARNVPAYIVFSDATLRAMAESRPTSPAALLDIPGVGPAKLERYGEEFLEVLRVTV
jgi:ATP-dependent DNA helicase RecQ